MSEETSEQDRYSDVKVEGSLFPGDAEDQKIPSRRQYYGTDFEWYTPLDAYIGSSSNWIKQRSKLIGWQGLWLEIFDDEDFDFNSSFQIASLAIRAGNEYEGDLVITGPGIFPFATPVPNDYAYYPLRKNFGENVQNFSNLQSFTNDENNPVEVIVSGNDAGVVLDPTYEQYFRTKEIGVGNYDLYALVGQEGDRYFLFGMQFKLDTIPPAGERYYLFYAGAYYRRLAVYVNDASDLVFEWQTDFGTQSASIPAWAKTGEWQGFFVQHNPEASQDLRFQTHDGEEAFINNPTFFRPANPLNEEDSNYLYFGRGELEDGLQDSTEWFIERYVSEDIEIVNPDRIQYSGDLFKSAVAGDIIYPNTGKYYAEIVVNSGFDAHLGVAPPNINLEIAITAQAWCVGTFNGNSFVRQSGPGNDFTSPVPNGSRFGVLYDSDLGKLEYFVDGVSRGEPFPDSTINEPVKFAVDGSQDFDITADNDATPPVTAQPFPPRQEPTSTTAYYFDGMIRNLFLRNEPYLEEVVQENLIAPEYEINLKWEDSQGNIYDGDPHRLNYNGPGVLTTVPPIPPGNYSVYFSKQFPNSEETNRKQFTIVGFEPRTEPLDLDFERTSLEEVDRELIAGHKQWGGANGGIIDENVYWDEEEGALICLAQGEAYKGPKRGVDKRGRPTDVSTRIGGCVATTDYFGPGTYQVIAKLPRNTGVVTAFWTFHYEESYPGHPLYDIHTADGLTNSGTAESGFYKVRNHEIDFEFPTALKTDPDIEVVRYTAGRFNTWQGELRSWGLDESDPNYFTEYTDMFTDFGFPLNDGLFHDFTFEWHLEPTPKVDFYIDGILVETVTTNVPDIAGRFWVGLWFPSAEGNFWGGRDANWDEEVLVVKNIKIEPYVDQFGSSRRFGESYPNVAFRRMDNPNFGKTGLD